MATTYRLTPSRRAANRLVRLLLKLGLMPGPTYLLTVPGRRTGRPLSTPVTLVEEGNARWLVAPYGDVAWVRSARAAGQVTLSRGSRSETLSDPGAAFRRRRPRPPALHHPSPHNPPLLRRQARLPAQPPSSLKPLATPSSSWARVARDEMSECKT